MEPWGTDARLTILRPTLSRGRYYYERQRAGGSRDTSARNGAGSLESAAGCQGGCRLQSLASPLLALASRSEERLRVP